MTGLRQAVSEFGRRLPNLQPREASPGRSAPPAGGSRTALWLPPSIDETWKGSLGCWIGVLNRSVEAIRELRRSTVGQSGGQHRSSFCSP